MLPRVPREVRTALVGTVVRVLVDYGLSDVEQEEYPTLADELCEIIRSRRQTDTAEAVPC
jgi:hypothetical protein